MPLPEHFQFSQGSLQDYVDCPRRFQLKYIQQLDWPAVDVEPVLENEVYLQLGATFHRMVQQYLLGVPTEKLALLASQEALLSKWWENFTLEEANIVNREIGNFYPEISLSIPIGNFRLTGKYDLLEISEHTFTIFDWKTSRKHPKREWLAANMQTRVYPYILTQAGNHFNQGKPIAPNQVKMIYWFSNFPTEMLSFQYNQAQKMEDEIYFTRLVDEINLMGEEGAPLTKNEKLCHFCVYRSLCNRGVEPGQVDELEDDAAKDLFEFDLDFDQITEIEF